MDEEEAEEAEAHLVDEVEVDSVEGAASEGDMVEVDLALLEAVVATEVASGGDVVEEATHPTDLRISKVR